MSSPLAIGIVALVLGLNICTTFFVARNGVLLKRHKVVQLFLIWLLPVLGALASAIFLYSIQEVPASKPSQYIPDNNEYPAANLPSHGGNP